MAITTHSFFPLLILDRGYQPSGAKAASFPNFQAERTASFPRQMSPQKSFISQVARTNKSVAPLQLPSIFSSFQVSFQYFLLYSKKNHAIIGMFLKIALYRYLFMKQIILILCLFFASNSLLFSYASKLISSP